MPKRIIKGLYHFIWYLIAGIILTAAVSVTIIRLALPEIGMYKHEIQTWVSQYMGYPVKFSKIEAEWEGWIPHLSLLDISLLDRNGKNSISHFKTAHIDINPLQSLRYKRLIPKQLIVSGLKLDLIRNKDGSLAILGGEAIDQYGKDVEATELSLWLFSQTNIILQNAQVTWTDKKRDKDTIEFSNVTLKIRSFKERLQINVYASLPELLGESFELRLDAHGNLLTPDWDGKLYLEAKNLVMDQLLSTPDFNLHQTSSNFRIWSDWKDAKLISFNSEINYQDFNLSRNSTDLSIPKFSATIAAQRTNKQDWSITLGNREFLTENGLWPEARYSLQLINNEDKNTYIYKGRFEYINLEDVLAFSRPFINVKDLLNSFFEQYNVSGELNNFVFSYNPNNIPAEIFEFSTAFSSVNLIDKVSHTALTGLKGTLSGNLEHLSVDMASSSVTVEAPLLFDNPVWFSSINGQINWNQTESGNRLEFPLLKLNTSDFPVSFSGHIDFISDKDSPYVDLMASIGDFSLDKVVDYLPTQISLKLARWLNKSLVSGQISSADILLRGLLEDYPYTDSSGILKAVINIANATFEYKEDWPPIDKLDAEIIVENNKLEVITTAGKIYDANIKHARALVNNFEQSHVHVLVNGKITGHTSHAKLFIKQSPLAEKQSLHNLANSNLTGHIELMLDLDIPLGGGLTIVDGNIEFFNTSLESEITGLGLQKINGQVNFTENSIKGNNINALYSMHPVEVSINSDKDEPTEFILEGKANNEFIISQIITFYPSLLVSVPDLQKIINGESKWIFKITKDEDNSLERTILLRSDLRGISLDLPGPFGKSIEESRSLQLTTQLNKNIINNIRIEYDDLLYADLVVNNIEDLNIQSISIGLGEEPNQHKNKKLLVKGNIEKLDVSEWLDFLFNKTQPNNNNTTSFNEYEIEFGVSKLFFLANKFDNALLNISTLKNGYRFTIKSPDIQGEVFIPDDLSGMPVIANMERLVLKKNEASVNKKDPGPSPESLPALEFHIGEFIYNDINLGKVDLLTQKIDSGMRIEKVSFTKPGINITGRGTWEKVSDQHKSVFNFDLHANDLSSMLNGYGYTGSNIKHGETYIHLNANWDCSPINFSLDEINGDLSMDIGKGKLLDLEPAAGRLFGLLSLQTLPRRLALDFSDIFGKGFTFDSIRGNFSLEKGDAYTNNLTMRGPTADIAVTGRTGLSAKDYDQFATITPKVSNSLPVASALLGPVGVGFGAVLFLAGELFESIPEQIDKLLRYQYTITGNWDNPVIERVSSREKTAEQNQESVD